MSTPRVERINSAQSSRSISLSALQVVRSWRTAMFVVFAACGFALAAWVSRTPSIRDGLHASTAAMNVAGAANERALGRTVMPHFHATYSIGTLLGAGLGVLAQHLGLPVGLHLVLAAAIMVAAVVPALRLMPAGVGLATPGQPKL